MRRLWILAGVVALAACSGSDERLSHAEYQRVLDRTVNRLTDRMIRDPSPRALSRAIERAADELDTTHPPARVEGANDRLAASLHELAAQFREFATTVEHGRTEEVREMLTRIARSGALRDVQRAQAELGRAGYRVPSS